MAAPIEAPIFPLLTSDEALAKLLLE